MKKEFLAIITLAMLFTLSLFTSCSKDDEKQEEDLTSAFIGIWKSIDSESEVLYLELNNDRTGKWLALYNGKIEDTYKIKRWDYKETTFFITRENGENESAPFSFHGDKLQLGEVLYQKSNTNIPEPEKPESVKFTKDSITLQYGESTLLDANKPIEECNFGVKDEFYAKISINGNEATLNSLKVGMTEIYISHKEMKDTCIVTIKPKTSSFGNPILNLGVSRDYVREKMSNYQQGGSIGGYTGERYSFYKASDLYYQFDKEDNLVAIKQILKRSQFSFDQVIESMNERFDYTSGTNNVLWYKHEGSLIIRIEKKISEITIHYAKDPGTMFEYFPW